MTEHEAARAWRDQMGLSRVELAELTGYSKEAIYMFERGLNSLGRPTDPRAFKRFKVACLAARFLKHYELAGVDDWGWA